MAHGAGPAAVRALVLNDAYNANPASMAAALRALAALPARRRIAVLGLMAELGAGRATPSTPRVGALARDLGVEVIAVAVPGLRRDDRGRRRRRPAALGPLGDGDAVLVKGSRVAGLERLVDLLESTG